MPSSRHSQRSIPYPRERVPDERRFPLVPTPRHRARAAHPRPAARLDQARSAVDIVIDGEAVPGAAPTWTILEACSLPVGIDTPTLCYLENLTPVNVCRVCVVELTGARTLVPACSRRVEPGMDIKTDSPRVRLSRKMVLEFLGSSVDLSTAPQAQAYLARNMTPALSSYVADRNDPATECGGPRRTRAAGHHHAGDGSAAETVAQPVKVDNDLYVRDYSKCILCYKCVEACGTDAQNTFAIAVAGRGFDARISTEANVPLPDSACVYCGNCIGVCPTGALMFRSEYELRTRPVGRVAADPDRHDLSLLRRRLHALSSRSR